MADEEERGAERAPRMRLSQEKRDRFLEVLGQTGNRRAAAAAIGVEPRLMDQRRKFDPVLDRQWDEALEQADRRLSGASGPLDCIGGSEPMVIRRGPGGKLRIVKAGARRWSRKVEDRFFAALSESGNIAGSARAVGFTESCIAHRRRQWPDFARRLEEALEDAELALEFRMAAESGGLKEGFVAGGDNPTPYPPPASGRGEIDVPSRKGGRGEFDADLAMRFLKWREEKRRGGGRRGRVPAEPTIEQVEEEVLRRLAAIRKHRRRQEREREDGGSA